MRQGLSYLGSHTMLQFDRYRKKYGDHTVIEVPALELPQGIYRLQGTNGSGKTTLIKSIAGLIPYDGNITVAGNNIRKDRIAYTATVNYAEAEPQYPDFVTGNDLVRFYAATKNATAEQVIQLTDAMGIAEYAGNKTGTYSSGMAKKLSLVLAFMGRPKLVLLDEPLITLDVQAVANLQQLVAQYLQQGVTFLITSHQEMDNQLNEPVCLLIKDKTVVRA